MHCIALDNHVYISRRSNLLFALHQDGKSKNLHHELILNITQVKQLITVVVEQYKLCGLSVRDDLIQWLDAVPINKI